ncbi:MAG: HAD family hydrolase [Clostridia bacterium]|nr:HAD family hydrolase [Clostridia bacterium]
MIKALFFDLDGTLLPLDQDTFTNAFIGLIAGRFGNIPAWGGKAFLGIMMRSVESVVRNDGSLSNEDRFWLTMETMLPGKTKEIREAFLDFYATGFADAKAVTFPDARIPAFVSGWKQKGYRLFCATSPIFPLFVQEMRLRWAGFEEPSDWFEDITGSENCSFCKPNPDYYRDLCARSGLQPEDCLMIGNDADEDGSAADAGMSFFLLTDHMLNRKQKDLSAVPRGTWADLRSMLEDRTGSCLTKG